MFRSGWRADALAATTRGACQGYVKVSTMKRRHGAICKRQGTLTLTVGNLLPTGPFCWQHGRQHQDRALAQLVEQGRATTTTVKLEVITA